MWPSPQSSKCQGFSPKINSRLASRRETSLNTADTLNKSKIHSRDLSEFSNSFDLTYSNSSYTPTSRQNYDQLYLKEYKQIEGELDREEIGMKTYNFSDKYDYENSAKEFNAYFRYLENLGYLIKKKDQRLSASLFRGLLGVEKSFKKLISPENKYNKPTTIEPRKKVRVKEISIQTEQEIIIDDTITMTEEELETLKKLRMKLGKIKFSKISLRLCDLYDSLIKINTEIPELSFEPETVEFESLNIIKNLEANVKQFQSGIKNRLSQLSAKKSFDMECQTEYIEQINQAIIPDDKYKDLEIQYGHLRQRYDKVVHDKAKLEEEFHRNNLICQDIAKRYNDLEKESFTYEEKKKYLEDAIKLLRAKITDLSENLNRKRKKKVIIKKKIEDLNVILTGKRTRLNHLLNDIYQIKIHWRVSQEKLHQIMEAWEKTTGVPFDFNINIDQIIEKYNIKRSDSEASIHLSDEEEVEKISPRKDIKSVKKNKKISSSESSEISQEESSSEENKNYIEIPGQTGKSARIVRRTKKFAQTQPDALASRQNTIDSTKFAEENKIIKKPTKIFSTPTSKDGNLNADSNKLATPHHENNLNINKLSLKRIIKEEGTDIHQNTLKTFGNTNSQLIDSPEDIFISSLNENQLELYLKLKEFLENDVLHKKQQKLAKNSKWTQYSCEYSSLYTPRSRSKSRSISRPKRPYTRAEGDSMFFGNPRVVIHKSTVLDNFNIEYQGNLDPAKAKKLRGIGLLISMFNGDPDFELLSPNIKKEMLKCLDGHDNNRCREECIHLKRVLQIRARSRGTPYPIKKSSIDADL